MIINHSYDCILDDDYHYTFLLRGTEDKWFISANWTIDGVTFSTDPVREDLPEKVHPSTQVNEVAKKIRLYMGSGYYKTMPLREFMDKLGV